MTSIVEHIQAATQKRILIGIDLECTCWADGALGSPPRSVREVIEFGLAALDMEALELMATQSFLIKPQQHPELSEFCTKLTSITTEMLQYSPGFEEGLKHVMQWINQFDDEWAWCSWGMFDLHHLQQECLRAGLELPLKSSLHFNAKTLYSQSHPRLRRRGMKSALAHEGVKLEGTHHRGVDDATNMARLIIHEEQAKRMSRQV